jgi:VanZ family protein
MNPFFTVLVAAYIFCIFYMADSSIVSWIGQFNPFSLLHIPLYGILTILLLLAFGSEPKINPNFRYHLAAWVAIAVGILDEYYQSFIRQREASIEDIWLDISGVVLSLILARRFPPPLWMSQFKKLKK